MEIRAKTEEPSVRPKVHEFLERVAQTESIKRKQSMVCSGPSPKNKRLKAVFPDSACKYSSTTNEDENQELNENELPRFKRQTTCVPRKIWFAGRIHVPACAKNSFEMFGDDDYARIAARAATLRMLPTQTVSAQRTPEPLHT